MLFLVPAGGASLELPWPQDTGYISARFRYRILFRL